MNKTELQSLMHLPGSFQPPSADSPQYQWLINSIVSGLSLATSDTTALLQMMKLSNASSTWLDIWGQIYGLPRMGAETDAIYRARIAFSINAQHVTGAALLKFIQDLGISASLQATPKITTATTFKIYINSLLATTLHSVNYIGDSSVIGSYIGGVTTVLQDSGSIPPPPLPTTVGYDIYIRESLSQTELSNLETSLTLVRPAGIPFKIYINSLLATTLHSINYTGDSSIVGSYLGGGASVLQILHMKDYYIPPPNTLPMILRTDPVITGVITL